MDKYKCLTGEDLGLKPSTVEQAKFEYSPLDKTFNKGLSEDDKKEGMFKRLKNIENAQNNLFRDDDNESIYYTPKSEFGDKDDEYKKEQQTNNIDTKPPNVFDYLKSLSQEAKDLMDEIEEANDNFNTFRMLLNFLSAIYNGKTSLKEAEIFQRNLEIKIEELKCDYRPKTEKEKEEINRALMQANNLFKYRDKIVDAFKNGTFSSEHLKKLDDAGYDLC